MQLPEVIQKLRERQAELKQLGVVHLYVFGSTVRGEQRPDSDVDLFFDHVPGTVGLFRFMAIKEAASNALGCEADIMSRGSIDKFIRPRAEADAVPVF